MNCLWIPLQNTVGDKVNEKVGINLVPISTEVRMVGSISYIGYPGTPRQRIVKPGFAI